VMLRIRSPGAAGRRQTGAVAKTLDRADAITLTPELQQVARFIARRHFLAPWAALLVAELAGIGGAHG
jgi:hypothetical protein